MFSSVGLCGPIWPPSPAVAPFIAENPEGVRPNEPLEELSVRLNGAASMLEKGAIELIDPDLSSDLCAASVVAAVICLKLSAERGPETDG